MSFFCRCVLSSLLLSLVVDPTSGILLDTMRPTVVWAQTTPDNEAKQLYGQGVVFYKAQRWQQALTKFQSALELYQQSGNRLSTASTLNNIGLVYASLGNYPEALLYYEESLTLKRELGNREGEARTLHHIGNMYAAQTNPEQAIIYLKQAVDIYEDIRADNQTLEQELQTSFDAGVQGTYSDLANLLFQQGQASEARQILDLLEN